jgi:hypothetical protein
MGKSSLQPAIVLFFFSVSYITYLVLELVLLCFIFFLRELLVVSDNP